MQKNISIPIKKKGDTEEIKNGQKKPLQGLRTFQNDLLMAHKEKRGDKKTSDKKEEVIKKPKEKVVLKLVKTPPVPAPHYKTDVGVTPPAKTEIQTAEEKRATEKKHEEEVLEKKEEEELRQKREQEEALEKKKIQEEEREEHLQEEIEKIRIEKEELEKKLAQSKTEERRLLSEKEILITEKNRKDEILRPILEREAGVEREINEIEKREALTIVAEERRALEEKRWALEESRRGVERDKWEIEKELEKTIASIKEKDSSINDIANKKSTLDLRMMELEKEDERSKLAQQLKEISQIKKVVELEWINLNEKRGELEEILKPILEKETSIENEKRLIDEKERSISSTEEKRAVEQKRWGVEEERRGIEQKRWEIESKISKIAKEIETLKPKYQEALAKEEGMQKKLTEFS